MTADNTTMIPVDPPSHEELSQVLRAGGEPLVRLIENGTVFKMVKAKKGGAYDLIPLQVKETAIEKQARTESVFESLKDLFTD